MKLSQIAISLREYLRDGRGAVTVDWTVLGAAAVGLALATAGALTGAFGFVISRVDSELRENQTSDSFVEFRSDHFESLYRGNHLQSSQAEELFNTQNGKLNHDILTELHNGIEELENGDLTTEEVSKLVATASVAWQRNIVPDAVLDHYFGFGGNGSPVVANGL